MAGYDNMMDLCCEDQASDQESDRKGDRSVAQAKCRIIDEQLAAPFKTCPLQLEGDQRRKIQEIIRNPVLYLEVKSYFFDSNEKRCPLSE